MKFVIKPNIFASIILIFSFFSCTEKCKIDGIEVSELLMISSKDKNYDYCELLNNSIKNDISAIRKLSLLDFDNSVSYDHGAVLVDLISKTGQESFINAIKKTNKEERNKIKNYLEVGLMYYGKKKYEDKTLKEIFPEVALFLN